MKSFIKNYIDYLDKKLGERSWKFSITMSDRNTPTIGPSFIEMADYIKTNTKNLELIIDRGNLVLYKGYRLFYSHFTTLNNVEVHYNSPGYGSFEQAMYDDMKNFADTFYTEPMSEDNVYINENGDYILAGPNRNQYSINTKNNNGRTLTSAEGLNYLLSDSNALGLTAFLEHPRLLDHDLTNNVKKLELENFNADDKDWTKCSDDDKYRVFVVRRHFVSGVVAQRIFGSFVVSPEIADTKFHRCPKSGYLLTGLSNKYNERADLGNRNYVSSYVLNTLMVQCNSCGAWENKSDWTAEQLTSGACPTCKKRAFEIFTRNNVVPVEGIEIKKNYIGDPHRFNGTLQFLNVENAANPLFLGVELEVDTLIPTDYDNDEDHDEEDDSQNYSSFQQNIIASHILKKMAPKGSAYAMWDGSLANGFEIATHPATLKSHLDPTVFNYKGAFEDLGKLGYTSHESGTCGLHIHINRAFFGNSRQAQNLNAGKMAYLLEKHWPNFVLFSRRKEEQLDRWARVSKLYAEYRPIENAIDGAPISTGGKDREKGTHLRNLVRKHYPNGQKYVALNTQHQNTFEFRIFRGTLKYETFMATLILVDNLARLVSSKKVNDLTAVSFDDIINYGGYDTIKNYWATRKGGN